MSQNFRVFFFFFFIYLFIIYLFLFFGGGGFDNWAVVYLKFCSYPIYEFSCLELFMHCFFELLLSGILFWFFLIGSAAFKSL
jgi:hypothetical protein